MCLAPFPEKLQNTTTPSPLWDNRNVRVDNRSARYNYEILEKIEAGIDLLGPEVKSVREGQVSLNEAFVHIRDGQVFLINAHIHPYQSSADVIEPTRSRRLLLHKKEILSLANKAATLGLTIVPVSLYNKGNIFKVEIALARGKNKWDKREAIKRKDLNRTIEQELKIKS